MADLEKGKATTGSPEPTEKSALLKGKEADKKAPNEWYQQVGKLINHALVLQEMMRPSSWSFWWKFQATPKYKSDLTFALQTSFWVGIVITPALATNWGRKWFADHGFNIAYIVCNFLFNMGRNLGATTQNILGGAVGVSQACILVWLMNGFYPNGYDGTKDTEDAWYVGLAIIILFFSFHMCLNVDGSVRFWALYTFAPFSMAFINGQRDSRFSGNFDIEWTAPAVNTMGLYFIGSVPSILSCLFPKRVSAMDNLKQSMQEIIDANYDLQLRLVKYFSGAGPSMEVYDLTRDVSIIYGKIADARASHGCAYYECFNLGTTGTALRMMDEMLKSMTWMCHVLEVVIAVVYREDFKQSHSKIMDEVQNLCCEMTEKTHNLVMKMRDATCDGAISVEESEAVHIAAKENVKVLADLVESLEEACRKNNLQKIHPEIAQEQMFVYSMCKISTITSIRAKEFCEKKEKLAQQRTAGLWDLVAYLKAPYVTLTRSDVKWGLINLLSLTLSFYIGYNGWSPECLAVVKKHGHEHTCMIYPYNANPCCLIIMLLSKDNVGAVIQNGMDKICAVVVAGLTGQMAWTILGWCIPIYRLWSGLFVFFFVFFWMWVAYSSSGPFASLGTRLAAMGAMDVLAQCSELYMTDAQYSRRYHRASDYIVGLAIMLAVDLIFGGTPSSVQARKIMVSAMNDFGELFAHYFELDDLKEKGAGAKFHGVPTLYNQKDHTLVADRLQCIMNKVAEALSQGDSATVEPVLWHRPWRQVLLREIGECVKIPARLVRNISHIVGDDDEAEIVSNLLKRTPNFKKMIAYYFEMFCYAKDVAEMVLTAQGKGENSVPHEKWQACMLRQPFSAKFKDKDAVIADFNRLLSMEEFSKDVLSAKHCELRKWVDGAVPHKVSMRLIGILQSLQNASTQFVDILNSVIQEAA